jgi:hypothetical protein
MSTKEASTFVSIITGSTAAVAGDFVAFPIDTLKVTNNGNMEKTYQFTHIYISHICMQVRMQLHGDPLLQTFRNIRSGGLSMFYRGLPASSVRMATYGGMRLTIYEPIRNLLTGKKIRNKNEPVPVGVQVIAGALAGGISAAIMCPSDVLKIRMQGGEAQYRGVLDAFTSIIRHEV